MFVAEIARTKYHLDKGERFMYGRGVFTISGRRYFAF